MKRKIDKQVLMSRVDQVANKIVDTKAYLVTFNVSSSFFLSIGTTCTGW